MKVKTSHLILSFVGLISLQLVSADLGDDKNMPERRRIRPIRKDGSVHIPVDPPGAPLHWRNGYAGAVDVAKSNSPVVIVPMAGGAGGYGGYQRPWDREPVIVVRRTTAESSSADLAESVEAVVAVVVVIFVLVALVLVVGFKFQIF